MEDRNSTSIEQDDKILERYEPFDNGYEDGKDNSIEDDDDCDGCW